MTIYRDIWRGPSYATAHGMTYGAASKRYIVIHSTEGAGSASDEASYAKRRTDGVSSHYYADRNGVLQSTDTNTGANHVGSQEGNKYGIAYEISGWASWSRDEWKKWVNLSKLASAIARDCARWDIPIRHGSIADLKAHKPGIYTHYDFTRAIGGTDHTDPGSGFPLDLLIDLVKGEGTEMELNDTVNLTAGQKEMLASDPGVQDGIAVNTALGGSYAFSRVNTWKLDDVLKRLEALENKVVTPFTFSPEQFAQILAAIKEGNNNG